MVQFTFQITALAIAFGLISGSTAQISHPNQLPALQPGWDEPGKIIPGLLAGLPPMGVRWVEDWASIHILDWCKAQTQGFGLNPNDVETWNVHYDDCIEPWIMCRHKDARASKEQMIEDWGRIPLAMREVVRHIGLWPSNGDAAYSSGDNIAFVGPGIWRLPVIIHEVAHSVDGYLLRHIDSSIPFSLGSTWRNIVSRDTAAVSAYGRTSWPENFAESMSIAVTDHNAPGGVGPMHPNPFPAYWQFVGIRELIPEVIKSRGKAQCNWRHRNGNAVLKNEGLRTAKGVPLPDTSFKTDMKEIKPSGDKTTYVDEF